MEFGGLLSDLGDFFGSSKFYGPMMGLGALSDLYSGYLGQQQMQRQQNISNEFNNPAYVMNLVKQAYVPITDQQRQQLVRNQMATQSQFGLSQGEYPMYLVDQTLANDTLTRQQMAQNQALAELQGAAGSIPVPSQYGFNGGSFGSMMQPLMMQLLQQRQQQPVPQEQPQQTGLVTDFISDPEVVPV